MHPTTDDLRSDPLTHRFGDRFNPPGLTNFLGCVQVEADVTAVRNLNFPPFATGDHSSMAFILDGRLFQSLGVPVTITWYPDHVERRCRWRGLSIVTRTFLPVGVMAVAVIVELKNEGSDCESEIGVMLQHRVTHTTDWTNWLPPTETNHRVEVTNGEIIAEARDGRAFAVTLGSPAPDATTTHGLRYRIHLTAGATWRGVFVQALGESVSEVRATAFRVVNATDDEFSHCGNDWNRELKAIFTPGNDRYGGNLPALVTTNEAMRKIYWMGALGLAYFKRDSPFSVMGRTYDTLMPRYWQTLTCIWDYFLSAPAHVLLDPGVMRKL
ncbi:MAG: hypothetical protein WBW88_19090, partial [Rhodothermales bacterium]